MRFSTLARTAFGLAALLGPCAAFAQPITILNAAKAPPAAESPSNCAAAAPGAGADIECVLSLGPPPSGAQAAPARRILIRAQWAPTRCAPRGAQVVRMAAPTVRAGAMPIVTQAGSGPTCAS